MILLYFMNVTFIDPKMTADLKQKLECVEELLKKYKVRKLFQAISIHAPL